MTPKEKVQDNYCKCRNAYLQLARYASQEVSFAMLHKYNLIVKQEIRYKSLDSLLEKVKSHDLNMDWNDITNNIYDIVGIRIICPTLTDVYNTVSEIQDMDFEIIKIKDYIKNPKKSGYRSIHILLSKNGLYFEMQIRTINQHSWSVVEHDQRYKQTNVTKETKQYFESLAEKYYKMDLEIESKANLTKKAE